MTRHEWRTTAGPGTKLAALALAFVVGTAMIGTAMIGATRAADLPDPADVDHASARPAATEPGAPASDAAAEAMRSVQGYGAKNPLCLAWNDGCVTCRVGDDGPVCANPGPACVPKDEIACTQTKDPTPTKEPAK